MSDNRPLGTLVVEPVDERHYIKTGTPHPVLSDWRNDEKASDAEHLNKGIAIEANLKAVERDIESVKLIAPHGEATEGEFRNAQRAIEMVRKFLQKYNDYDAIECDVNPDLEG